MKMRNLFQKYRKASAGFTNIAFLITLATILIPGIKLTTSNFIQQSSPQQNLPQVSSLSRIADDESGYQKVQSPTNKNTCDANFVDPNSDFWSCDGSTMMHGWDIVGSFHKSETFNCPGDSICRKVNSCDGCYVKVDITATPTPIATSNPTVCNSTVLSPDGNDEYNCLSSCTGDWQRSGYNDNYPEQTTCQKQNPPTVCCFRSKPGSTAPSTQEPPSKQTSTQPSAVSIPPGAGYCGGDHHNPASGVTNPCPGRDSFDEAHSYPKYSYCESQYSGAFADWYTCSASQGTNAPGAGNSGGSGATIICDGHGNVDASYFSNGYYGPICTNITPSSDNFQAYIFDAAKAQKQTYKNYKNYDVFLCTDKSYDFAPKPPKLGNSDICGKYPWTQDASGAYPTAPVGHPACTDNTPVWDGQKCTVRPDACPNIGPNRGQNICESSPTNCGTPDTNSSVIPLAESDLACQLAFGRSDMKCCSKTTASPGAATATPTPTLALGATRAPTQTPTATPTAGSATATPTPTPSGGNPTFPPASAGICPDTYYSCAPQCKTGGQSPRPEDNSACNVYHSGSVCCLQSYSINPYPAQSSGSTASTGQSVTACTTNVQCVNSHQGNACVFYGASSIGVCKNVQ